MNKRLLILIVIIISLLFLYLLKSNKVIAPVPINFSYECKDGKSVNAIFTEKFPRVNVDPGEMPVPNGLAHIELSDGRKIDLDQTLSASGVRYANNDESFVFWSKGNGALVLEDNKEKSYMGCILVKDRPSGSNLSQVYINSDFGFTLRHSGYSVDEKYVYNISPTKQIHGVRFQIPDYLKKGTNLSSDTYLSVEMIPQEYDCKASLFLEANPVSKEITENQTLYSIASSSGAGAGNRYEEIVYALSGTNPCIAIRYFIHYGVIENYDPGAVKEFNLPNLIHEFDLIRSTLTLAN